MRFFGVKQNRCSVYNETLETIMKNRKTATTVATTIATAAMGLFFSANSMANYEFPERAPKSTVDTCVAEISDHADYTDAVRVLHEVESKQRRTVGHILKIDTYVYGAVDGALLREYKSTCAVAKGPKPVKFRIEETPASA